MNRARLLPSLFLCGVFGCSGTSDPEPAPGASSSGGALSSGSSGGQSSTGGEATGGAASGGGVASGGSVNLPSDCSGTVPDECTFETGLSHACVKRFALGINYAWHDFAADFGGLSQWNVGGVAANSAIYADELAAMSNNGAQTVRWWMFPDFRGDGVEFDEQDAPTGLTSTAQLDIATALDLAEAQDVYLVLTLFSFDNFRPTRDESDVHIPGMSPLIRAADLRKSVIDNIVRPVAQAVASSENSHRLLGWDIINEPEWAIAAEDGAPDGGQFTPNEELDAITLAEMKSLINEASGVLHEITPNAPVSVGWAAAKWAWAFQDVDVDFQQPHIYAWVNDYWPYTLSPTALGYGDKPVVMGEFHLHSMPFETGPSYEQIVSSWYDSGYAGAWSWQYIENADSLPLIKAFADQKGCTVRY